MTLNMTIIRDSGNVSPARHNIKAGVKVRGISDYMKSN